MRFVMPGDERWDELDEGMSDGWMSAGFMSFGGSGVAWMSVAL